MTSVAGLFLCVYVQHIDRARVVSTFAVRVVHDFPTSLGLWIPRVNLCKLPRYRVSQTLAIQERCVHLRSPFLPQGFHSHSPAKNQPGDVVRPLSTGSIGKDSTRLVRGCSFRSHSQGDLIQRGAVQKLLKQKRVTDAGGADVWLCALDGRDFHSSICDWAMHRGTCVSLRCSLRTVILCGRRCCTFGMLI